MGLRISGLARDWMQVGKNREKTGWLPVGRAFYIGPDAFHRCGRERCTGCAAVVHQVGQTATHTTRTLILLMGGYTGPGI